MNKNMDTSVIWQIRDLRVPGMTSNEKTLLVMIASRGILKSSRETTMADCCFKKDTYYKVKNSLVSKGIVIEHRGKFNPASGKRDQTYLVIDEAVLSTLPSVKDSVTQNKDSVTQNKDSVTQNKDSVEPDIKVTVKETEKETKKETGKETNSVAIAPSAEPTNIISIEDTSASLDIPPIKEVVVSSLSLHGVKTVEEDSVTQNPQLLVETVSSEPEYEYKPEFKAQRKKYAW